MASFEEACKALANGAKVTIRINNVTQTLCYCSEEHEWYRFDGHSHLIKISEFLKTATDWKVRNE